MKTLLYSTCLGLILAVFIAIIAIVYNSINNLPVGLKTYVITGFLLTCTIATIKEIKSYNK